MIIGPFDSSGSLYYNYSQLPKEYHVASMECKALFFAYEAVGIRSFKILLYDGVPTDKIAFTEKLV